MFCNFDEMQQLYYCQLMSSEGEYSSADERNVLETGSILSFRRPRRVLQGDSGDWGLYRIPYPFLSLSLSLPLNSLKSNLTSDSCQWAGNRWGLVSQRHVIFFNNLIRKKSWQIQPKLSLMGWEVVVGKFLLSSRANTWNSCLKMNKWEEGR